MSVCSTRLSSTVWVEPTPSAPSLCPLLCKGAGQAFVRRPVASISLQSKRKRTVCAVPTYPLLERSGPTLNNGLGISKSGPRGAVCSHTWLAACVRNIVSSLGGQAAQTPTLQLVFSSTGSSQPRFETVPVSPAVADDPQSWGQLATYVRKTSATGLVLVRPIASPEQHCAFGSGRSPPTASTSSRTAASASPSTSASACSASCPPASAVGAAPTPASLAQELSGGRVGDCCEGSGSTGHAASRASSATGTSTSAFGGGGNEGGDDGGGQTRYYGLVVQGSCASEADGCWVLKTTRSDSGGAPGLCACVHFALTRVCYGQPLYEQLRDVWLVQQSAPAASGVYA